MNLSPWTTGPIQNVAERPEAIKLESKMSENVQEEPPGTKAYVYFLPDGKVRVLYDDKDSTQDDVFGGGILYDRSSVVLKWDGHVSTILKPEGQS